MIQEYHLSTDTITPNFLENIREHYPHAQVEIRVTAPKNVECLTEKKFWELIEIFDWTKADDDNAIIENTVKALSELPLRQIYEFQDLLSEKLFALDTRKHAANTGENAYENSNSDFSADEFLYARCCVVANGKDFHKKILQNPSLMPQDLTFETLLTVAHKAYFLKTNKQFRYVPTHNIETFANKIGWEK